ncbi:serine protease [Gammaproteobacteria bacterium]|nr:serine protease [Gammaproteobacteria bacterium]
MARHKNILLISLFLSTSSLSAFQLPGDQLGQPLQYKGIPKTSDSIGTRSDLNGITSKHLLRPSTIDNKLTAITSIKPYALRGAKEIKLYSSLSPKIVMVLTNESVGTGSIIDISGNIITNWHVVAGYNTVGIIYKPEIVGAEISKSNLVMAEVVRIDEVSDLALLKPSKVKNNIAPIAIGLVSDIFIGSDVHAIGHPTGQTWTYTKGIVSQIRKNHEWTTKSGKKHKADVIQTQTPINPGNSGGPLISDARKLVGINSFMSDGEGLNFAVSSKVLLEFLSSTENRYAENVVSESESENVACEIKVLDSFRNEENNASITTLDTDCDSIADANSSIPDDTSLPETISIDSSKDGKIDKVYCDTDRDGLIDISFYDTDGDGKEDLIGYHKNGDTEPYKYEKA